MLFVNLTVSLVFNQWLATCTVRRPVWGSYIVPDESLSVTTLPPSCKTFSVAYWATLPDPDTATILFLKESPLVYNISSAKYTQP